MRKIAISIDAKSSLSDGQDDLRFHKEIIIENGVEGCAGDLTDNQIVAAISGQIENLLLTCFRSRRQ